MTLREACVCVSALVAALAASGCSSRDEAPEDGAAAPSSSADMAGGSTSDFTGDRPLCEAIRYETPEDSAALGFSMSSLLAASVGGYDVPLRWDAGCQAENPAACAASSAMLTVLDGQETMLRLNIEHGGDPAVVRHPSAEQPSCAQDMKIPVQVQLQTDDGVLNEDVTLSLWSECGNDVSAYLDGPLSMLKGTLAGATRDLGASARIELSFGFFKDGLGFGLYVLPSPGAISVFSNDLPPFGQRTQYVPRTSVERQPGTPLADTYCRRAGPTY